MSENLCNEKICLVTGSGGGLGKAIAESFLNAGAKVVLIDKNAARLSECFTRLLSAHPDRVLALEVDITDEASVQKMIIDAVEKLGKLDVLVNNAGIMDHFDPVGDLESTLWDRVIAVNLTAPMLTLKAAVKQMLSQEKPGGVILNVGSTSSLKEFCAGAAYTASKHGLIGLTKNTATYYAKKGIRCVAILPAGMRTNAYRTVVKSSAFKPPMVETNKAAKVCLHLCLDNAEYMNGACVPIDDG
ncbi:NAD(P)-binding protein [Glonium stellatum]|uniref:NAD(P)-binding protein n=1 Tax=Glonium stellatum TaxID=574774 RepID=A0A8E2JQJ4_9PEZI|nr:NAD(P)-binding protein [Glonium stellatum]